MEAANKPSRRVPFKEEKGHRVRGYSKKHLTLANSLKKRFWCVEI
jgi:hypothetical protein